MVLKQELTQEQTLVLHTMPHRGLLLHHRGLALLLVGHLPPHRGLAPHLLGHLLHLLTLTDASGTPSDYAYGIAVDNSGNVYVCGRGRDSSNNTVQSISKWNTSGTIQWQRTLTDASGTPSDYAYGIAVDNSGNVYVCGSIYNSSGNQIQSIAKLPADGSKTGTYSGTNFGVTYDASSWTAATSSWTSATSSWTSATSSWTSASSSWTSATSTWTTDKALIP